jgi:hypothetical protein
MGSGWDIAQGSTETWNGPSQPPDRRRWWTSIGALAVVLAALGLFQTTLGRDLLQLAGLVAQPVGYTELAFARPAELTQELPAAETLTKPEFVIHNVSGAPRDYRWSIMVTEGGNTRKATAGSTPVASGQRVIISPSLRVNCVPGRLTIRVELDGGEAIHQGITCTRSQAGLNG